MGPAIGLCLGLIPALAEAQTSIDSGKTPAEIFAIDCATCHKGARGLAHGKTSSELASFLVEHYTSSRDQAAALAAYVMGAGGGDAVSAQRGPKPTDTKPADANKPQPPGRTAKPTGKPEETPAPTAKLKPDDDKKPPGATATRGNRRTEPEPAPAAPQPPTVVAAPAPSSTPAPDSLVPAPSAASPASADSGENAPVPRDDIPD
jgi:hypothetical protein